MRFKFVALLIFFGSLGLFHGQASTDEIELDDVPEQILDNNAYEERKMDSLLNSIKETDDVIFPKTIKTSISPKSMTILLPNQENLSGKDCKENS